MKLETQEAAGEAGDMRWLSFLGLAILLGELPLYACSMPILVVGSRERLWCVA